VVLRGRCWLLRAAVRTADAIDRVQGREQHQEHRSQQPSHDTDYPLVLAIPPVSLFDKIKAGTPMADLPIFCTLTPAALEARKQGLLSTLLKRSAGRELLPEGLRLRFEPSSEMLSRVVGAVDAERQCCRFLRFTITVEPDGEGVILDLTGPPGTREFVAALLEL
jgi:hypothetical protein